MKLGDMVRHRDFPNDRLEVWAIHPTGTIEAAGRWRQVAAPADEFESWFRTKTAADALAAPGEARAILESVITADPTRSGPGSVQDAHGLGGTLQHVEMAIAELVESLKPEELEQASGQHQG